MTHEIDGILHEFVFNTIFNLTTSGILSAFVEFIYNFFESQFLIVEVNNQVQLCHKYPCIQVFIY